MVIVVDALTAGLLVFFGVSALTMVAEEHAFIRRFVIAPITQLTHAIETSAAMLKSAQAGGLDVRPGHPDMITAVDNLSQFMRTYRSEFMTANNPSKYAERFRSDLHARNQDSLIAAEEVGVAAVEQALDRLRAEASQVGGSPERIKAELQSLRVALRGLLRTNGSFVEVSHTVLEDRTRTARFRLVLVGVIGVILSTLLGLRVRRAVIPRMNRIVTAVRDFQRGGRHQRVNDMGNDEITVLANAVDAGLEAIERRDREREHFLSVAAHELKTPLTSILGFTQAALEHPENEPVRRRALEVIRRHARRLGRLVEDLFLAAGAQTGQLQFHPDPADLAAVVRHVVVDVEPLMPGRTLEVIMPERAPLLGDRRLLEHGLWSLLSYSAAAAGDHPGVSLRITHTGAHWRVEVTVPEAEFTADDLQRAFSPFTVVQFERAHAVRNAVGLFLAREVVRLHGGRVYVEATNGGFVVAVELPG